MQVLKTSISIWRWYLLQLYLCNFSVHHYWYIFHSELKIQSYKLLNFGFQYCRYVGPSSNDLHLTGAKIKNDTSFVSSSLMLSVNNLRLIFNIITHSQGLDFLLRKTQIQTQTGYPLLNIFLSLFLIWQKCQEALSDLRSYLQCTMLNTAGICKEVVHIFKKLQSVWSLSHV